MRCRERSERQSQLREPPPIVQRASGASDFAQCFGIKEVLQSGTEQSLGEVLQEPNRKMPVQRPERSESATWSRSEAMKKSAAGEQLFRNTHFFTEVTFNRILCCWK